MNFLCQVALEKPVKELTKNIIRHIRLLLLSPEELSLVETENEKDSLIPVMRNMWQLFYKTRSPVLNTFILLPRPSLVQLCLEQVVLKRK